jgi:hypothetical protein
MVRAYIRHQELEDERYDQMKLGLSLPLGFSWVQSHFVVAKISPSVAIIIFRVTLRRQRRVPQKVGLEVLEINKLRPDLPQKMGLLATEVGISCDFATKDEIL